MAALNVALQEEKNHERDKYQRMWRHDAYRNFSPGECLLEDILNKLQIKLNATVIDFGCGTGRAAQKLSERGYRILAIDFADNCLDRNIKVPFLAADLTDLPQVTADYGICCDVMEHIPTRYVDDVLAGIARSVKAAFFSIALCPDAFGAVIGEPLHLTVKPIEWWDEKLRQHFPAVSCEPRGSFMIALAGQIEVEALCNTPNEVLFANVETNSRRDLPWLVSVPEHDGHAVMVGGGPSLKNDIEGIRARQKHGQIIFALNDAANFLKAYGITPDYQLVLDAREENARFVLPRSAKKYLIASQCHPALFDELQGDDVTVFHWGMAGIMDHLPKGRKVCLLAGGYVLGPIAMAAAYVLGYRALHLYGYDSSDADDGSAHAYGQTESDKEKKRLEVSIAGRKFRCSFGMFKQAEQFPAFAKMLSDNGCVITVHGDGLLPTVARQMLIEAQSP